MVEANDGHLQFGQLMKTFACLDKLLPQKLDWTNYYLKLFVMKVGSFILLILHQCLDILECSSLMTFEIKRSNKFVLLEHLVGG